MKKKSEPPGALNEEPDGEQKDVVRRLTREQIAKREASETFAWKPAEGQVFALRL